jgi:hypothetical protein
MDMLRIQSANAAPNVGVLVSLKKLVTMKVKETNKEPNKCISVGFRAKVKLPALRAGLPGKEIIF